MNGDALVMYWGWGYIKAPTRASRINDMEGRSVRTPKTALQSIAINDGRIHLTQELITLAAIAKNHTARAITGFPPEFAMTGRCDIAIGESTCVWEHGPLSRALLIPQMAPLRDILDARDATAQADSENAVRLILNHNRQEGKRTFFAVASAVQIAVGRQRSALSEPSPAPKVIF